MFKRILFLFSVIFYSLNSFVNPLPNHIAKHIAQKIWRNECNNSITGLTTWNNGEEFGSFGIAHCIWYPPGIKGPFKESFPALIAFLKRHKVKIPNWLEQDINKGCPWQNRQSFLQEFNGKKMQELRALLSTTIDLQTTFMIQNFYKKIPQILVTSKNKMTHVKQQFNRLVTSDSGIYALIDYFNFKGAGIKPTEAYKGVRWGLLQVLEQMVGSTSGQAALQDFRKAAEAVLKKRIAHAPPLRNEQRWLQGWLNRIDTYTAN